jgi:hypothetical protein
MEPFEYIDTIGDEYISLNHFMTVYEAYIKRHSSTFKRSEIQKLIDRLLSLGYSDVDACKLIEYVYTCPEGREHRDAFLMRLPRYKNRLKQSDTIAREYIDSILELYETYS